VHFGLQEDIWMPRDESAGLNVGAQPPKTVIAALQKAVPRIIAADFHSPQPLFSASVLQHRCNNFIRTYIFVRQGRYK
jgi:hypothetical protein